jgi:hypothetical protein
LRFWITFVEKPCLLNRIYWQGVPAFRTLDQKINIVAMDKVKFLNRSATTALVITLFILASVNAQVAISNDSAIFEADHNDITEMHTYAFQGSGQAIISAEGCLVSLWNHRRDIDITELVAELGFNLIWSHDDAYTGQAWEDTHMYRLLQVPGVDYVLAKIERAAWGWTHEMSLRHARWIALLSRMYPGIIGVYLNDFYDEVEDGYRTEDEWREIIDAIKSINPDLQLWAPHYPHRDQGRHDFDFEIDTIILNLWGNDPELMAQAEQHLAAGIGHHPGRNVIAGLYLWAGTGDGRWLTEDEFKNVLGHFVDMANSGKIAGLRIFAAYQLLERPEYIGWAKEVLGRLTCK